MEKNRLSDANHSLDTPRRASASGHICVVTETYPPEVNGVALTLGHLVKGLLARGHVVSLVRPHQRTSDTFSYGRDANVTIVRGLPIPGYNGLQFGLPAGGPLRHSWTRRRPDVVYVATEGPLGWSAVRAARRLAIPVFSGFHTNFHSYSRHYRLGCLQYFVLRYLRRFHNRTAGTFVPSLDLRDSLQGLGFRNVSFLGRGVDSGLFAPERRCRELRRHWGVSDEDLAVLHVGRIAGEKNLGLAIQAYRAIQRIDRTAKFILVGDGPLRSSLQRENPDLIFSGTQISEQLARHYASADVFLFPSETETFGNVTLEAMASGLVVIAYDYAAAKSHIVDGETGVLVPYGDSKAYVDSAVRLIRESQAIEAMRRLARAHVMSVDWTGTVEQFEALLTQSLDHSHTAINSALRSRSLTVAARGRT